MHIQLELGLHNLYIQPMFPDQLTTQLLRLLFITQLARIRLDLLLARLSLHTAQIALPGTPSQRRMRRIKFEELAERELFVPVGWARGLAEVEQEVVVFLHTGELPLHGFVEGVADPDDFAEVDAPVGFDYHHAPEEGSPVGGGFGAREEEEIGALHFEEDHSDLAVRMAEGVVRVGVEGGWRC